jgi:hypothetical protein
MSITVLIINPEPVFFLELTGKLAAYKTKVDFNAVNNRMEALAAMEKSSFQFIITSLKIPRLSDGYRFLSQITGKLMDAEKILALVDKKTSGVTASLTSLGLHHISEVDDVDHVVRIVGPSLGLVVPAIKTPVEQKATSVETQQIRKALNQVMGPVGTKIYSKVVPLWGDTNNSAELIKIIAEEIGEEELIDQFYALL